MSSLSPLTVNDLQQIHYGLNCKPPLLNGIGKITQEGRWNYYVNNLMNRPQPRLLVLVEKINQAFAELEQRGVKIFVSTIREPGYVQKKEKYQKIRHIYLDVAQSIARQLEAMQEICPELKKAFHELQYREMGLRYSLGQSNGGLDPLDQPDQQLLALVKEKAREWKRCQQLCLSPELNELENEQLEELAKYPEWLKIVLSNQHDLSEAFNWCLRDFNQVEVMVKCYETQRKLKVSLLSSHLGYVRNIYLTERTKEVITFETVATKTAHVGRRILSAVIYHGSFTEFEPHQQNRVNILDPNSKIHFKKGNYHLTVKEFLHELSQKNAREVNVSLCADWGFINFHPLNGIWNADRQEYERPVMSKENWTDHVPPSRIASHAELVAQYGQERLKHGFFFKVMATRQSLDLKALNCHGFWQLFLRMKDGNWRVLNIGAYAYRFQQGLLDGLWLFCATVKRAICLMDQNGYYTHRQRGGIVPPHEKQEDVLVQIHHLLTSQGFFQFAARNCACNVQESVENSLGKDVPNLYKFPLTKSSSGIGPLDRLLAWADGRWSWVRSLVLTMLDSFFLSHRSASMKTSQGVMTESVRKYFSQHGHDIYNPSYLLHQIEQAKKMGQGFFAKGELYWSHTEEKLFQSQAKKMEVR